MARGDTSYFIVIPRRRRAKGIVPTLRTSSSIFIKCLRNGDANGMERSSKAAWESLTKLFEILRNEEDQGFLPSALMKISTAFMVDKIDAEEMKIFIKRKKINRHHVRYNAINLRQTLNKIAHHDPDLSTFRVDGRGSHYLLLGGCFQNHYWMAEILVSRLCKHAAKAIRGINDRV